MTEVETREELLVLCESFRQRAPSGCTVFFVSYAVQSPQSLSEEIIESYAKQVVDETRRVLVAAAAGGRQLLSERLIRTPVYPTNMRDCVSQDPTPTQPEKDHTMTPIDINAVEKTARDEMAKDLADKARGRLKEKLRQINQA